MTYTVKRTLDQEGTIVSYENVFSILEEAMDFYNGTNGALNVDLYDETGSKLYSKGSNATSVQIMKAVPSPVAEVPKPVVAVEPVNIIAEADVVEIDTVEVEAVEPAQESEYIDDDIPEADPVDDAKVSVTDQFSVKTVK